MTRASSLGDLISFAYEVQAKQIVNAPDWLEKDRYDIEAAPEQEGVPNPEQIRIMIRKLLADRFALKFHHDKRDMSAYVLTVGKDGNKLKPTQIQGNLPGIGIRPGTGGITLNMVNATIGDFTGFLQMLVLDRPVVDKTGIQGRYDYQCTFTPDDSQFGGHPPPMPKQDNNNGSTDAAAAAAPSLYDALQQELGLKLSAEKTAVDVIAIDHVDKPTRELSGRCIHMSLLTHTNSRGTSYYTCRRSSATTEIVKLEFQIMETLWARNECSIREIQESFPLRSGQLTRPSRRPFTEWRRRASSTG